MEKIFCPRSRPISRQTAIQHSPGGRLSEKFLKTTSYIYTLVNVYVVLKDYRLQSFLSIQYVHGDLCKHVGIDSSTDHLDRYSNLFLNAYINRHVHAEYLKMIEVYSPLGIWHVFLYSSNTNIYHFRSMKYRQYA